MEVEIYEDEAVERLDARTRLGNFSKMIADRANIAEARFLSLLRYSALMGAAVALIISALLLGVGLVRQVGRTEVEPQEVTIAAGDVVPVKAEKSEVTPPEVTKLSVPKAIRQKTAAIYKRDFAPHERSEAKISEAQVVDLVWTEERVALFDELAGAGLLDAKGEELAGKSALMEDALETVSKATKAKDYVGQLVGYRDAKKVNVCTNVSKTKKRTVEAWNSYATSCPYWWESPVGCSSTRVISEPYVEKVCEMKFPKELEAPGELFAASIQRYADVAQDKLESARIDASVKTAENNGRKLKGQGNIGTSGKLFLGFLLVMFLYLFIAMERHNRNLRALMQRTSD
jgi:hypothetical protein